MTNKNPKNHFNFAKCLSECPIISSNFGISDLGSLQKKKKDKKFTLLWTQ